MPRVFFIRHCESVSNFSRILAGRLSFSLTEKGKKHAEEIALNFQKKVHNLDFLYVSPQKRTHQTAQPFAKNFSLIPIFEKNLQEQDWGIFSGKTYDELKKDPDFHHPQYKNWNFQPQGGENYQDVCNRVTNFLNKLYKLDANKTILCVTHGGTLRIIRGILKKTVPEYESEVPQNGEIWEVSNLNPFPYVHKIIKWDDTNNYSASP